MNSEIIDAIAQIGGTPYMVGGCVRDTFLGESPKDIDIEVYGVSYESLNSVLERFGKTDLIGVSFGIIKLTTFSGEAYDFSLPRLDSKNGVGHKGFTVEVNKDLSLKEASARRDFTINSMSINMVTGELVDYYDGKKDLRCGLLQPTSGAFSEDPLRVLRGLQFSARFNMGPSVDLIFQASECMQDFNSLPSSRIWGEWEKWIHKGAHYSKSLKYLYYILSSAYPDIAALDGVPQDPQWHPEGNVLVHTGFVLDYMGRYCREHEITGDRRAILILAALCHDFGKLTHTQIEDGRIKSKGHEGASESFARKFLAQIGCPLRLVEPIIGLVVNHMAAYGRQSEKSVRKLANRLYEYNTCIEDLAILIEADKSGRPPLPQGQPEDVKQMLQLSVKENCNRTRQTPIVSGGQIMAAGYEGPIIGKIQKRLYEMQLNGSFNTAETGLWRIKSFIKQL
jgi:tRNA nucleotidyltransferase (CCA-adding enzyme)